MREIHEFAEGILNDRPLNGTIEDSYKAELLALAARTSWKEKRTVSLVELNIS